MLYSKLTEELTHMKAPPSSAKYQLDVLNIRKLLQKQITTSRH